MYKPSDDTFLLAECIKDLSGDYALDICTGSGYIASILSKNFKYVFATDIDINALLYAKMLYNNIQFICCKGASCLNRKFDLITLNPPYLPSNEIEDITIDGGKEGVEVTLDIMSDCIRLMHNYTRMLIVSSSLANINKILNLKDFKCKIIRSKRIGFEDIVIIEARIR